MSPWLWQKPQAPIHLSAPELFHLDIFHMFMGTNEERIWFTLFISSQI